MEFEKRNFPSILPDNEFTYLKHLEGVINSIDNNSSLLITRRINGYALRIAPSHPMFIEGMVKQMKQFHTQLGILLEFSKSIKTASTISFNINF